MRAWSKSEELGPRLKTSLLVDVIEIIRLFVENENFHRLKNRINIWWLLKQQQSRTLRRLCFTWTRSERTSPCYSTIRTASPRAAWGAVPLPWGSPLCSQVLFAHCTFNPPSLHYADSLISSLRANPPAAICHRQMFQRTVTSSCSWGGMGVRLSFWLETCRGARARSRWVMLASVRSRGQLISRGNQGGNRGAGGLWSDPDTAVMGARLGLTFRDNI